MYFAVKNKFESLPKPKDDKKKQAKKKPEKKKKKSEDVSNVKIKRYRICCLIFIFTQEEKKDSFSLPPIVLRRSSYSKAEAMLAQELNDGEKILFRPLHAWTQEDTTEQLLEQKKTARERLGWEVDFPNDYKMPLMKNVYAKVEKLGGIEAIS